MHVVAQNHDSHSAILPSVGGVAAGLVAAILLLGMLGVFTPPPSLGLRNWLVVLIQLNSGVGSLPASPLQLLNPMDLAVLVLTGVTFLGLALALGKHRIWMALGIALPFLGIPVLLATNQAGRSGIMGGGLIVSFVMVTSPTFRSLGYLGVAANVLLLVGDLATTGSESPVVGAVVGVGYGLLVVWFALICWRLLAWGRHI